MYSLHKIIPKYKGYTNFYKFLQTKAKQVQYNHNACDPCPVFFKAKNYTDKIAIHDSIGAYTYANLFMSAKELAKSLTHQLQGKPHQRVLFVCPNDASYVITQWAIWMSGQIAVPLSTNNPQNILEYYASDCEAKLLITTPAYQDIMQMVSKKTKTPLFVLDKDLNQSSIQNVTKKQSDMEGGLSYEFYNKSDAMILYTSGTTGKPKGVVITHKNICSQVMTLVDAWKWTGNDCLLHTLPLHHVHGIVNGLLCSLYVGAKCIMLPKFDANTVWSHLLGVNGSGYEKKVTIFMAVPTIYTKLIAEYDKVFIADPKMVEYIKSTLKAKMRLMISGSAPLPMTVFKKWIVISGHKLLERYGMTETGMILSNVYDTYYEPGYVGVPLPGVSIRIASKPEMDNEGDYNILLDCTNTGREIKYKNDNFTQDAIGELFVKSNGVFKDYYNKPGDTEEAFTLDGYFKTGDIVQFSNEKKSFKILGRKSVDIIKSGGYKLSALEIETSLLGHPLVTDCAVFGLPDDTWGESVAAIISLKPKSNLTYEELKNWAKEVMPDYHIPKTVKYVEAIPRNAMGKVNKKDIISMFDSI